MPHRCPPSPLVTVVIPAFNAADHIARTLLSVTRQTHKNLEIIVVDDGSTDDTAKIVSRFRAKDHRMMLIRQANRGLSAARNRGIHVAKGEYIANIDSDDVWRARAIERMLHALQTGPADARVAYGWSLGINEMEGLNGRFYMSDIQGQVVPALIYRFFVCNASSSLIHRSCFEALGDYDERFFEKNAQGCEDWDLHLRFAAMARFVVVPGFLTGYRQIPGNMSSNDSIMARSYRIVMENARKTYPGIPEGVYRWSSGNFSLYLALNSRDRGNFLKTWQWLLNALRQDPAMTLLRHDLYDLALRSLWDGVAHFLGRRTPKRQVSSTVVKKRLFQRKRGFVADQIVWRIQLYHRLPAQRWEKHRIMKVFEKTKEMFEDGSHNRNHSR